MEITNRQYHRGLSFEDYLNLPQYSYSFLKAKGTGVPAKQTPMMGLGTAVHNYLLEPEKFPHTDRKAKQLALSLKATIGPLLTHLEKELAVTCLMHHEGLEMPYKGRIDLCIPGKLVVDLKVTTQPIGKVIDFFGYHRQTSGYAYAIEAEQIFIVAINSKTLVTSSVMVRRDDDYWHKKILQYGAPA